MTKLLETLTLAEEALEDLTYVDHDGTIRAGKREDADVTDVAGKALAAIREQKAELEKQEPVGYQYLFNSPFGVGDVWRDSPSKWNGQQPKASRAIYAAPVSIEATAIRARGEK